MVKTRTKGPSKPSGSKAVDSRASAAPARALEDSIKEPPYLFILPKDIAAEARIITIPSLVNPAQTTRILVCPLRGFYEFTNVAQGKACRSWLLTPQQTGAPAEADGLVLRKPDLLISTPINPMFIVLALMSSSKESEAAYLSFTDYVFSTDLTGWQELQHLLRQPNYADLLKGVETSMTSIADSLSLGDDETLYRLSRSKVCQVLLQKAIRLADRGLPASISQQFVHQALDLPIVHTERSELAEEAMPTTQSEASTTQDTSSAARSQESTSTAPTSVSEPTSSSSKLSAEISRLLSMSTAWEYMLRSYVGKASHQALRALFKDQQVLDMKPLREHEARVAALKQEVHALRTLSDNISRKRAVDDDEAAAKQDEKRRKKEEEEQRKKSSSMGVKRLMKADTSGMKKLSSFFTKKT